METTYECASCKRTNVKLWRPYGYSSPLVCACCLETRQSPFEYDEVTWEKSDNGNYIGNPTGRKIQGKRWVVDNLGRVPSYHGPVPEGVTHFKTDQLIANIGDIDKFWASGRTPMIPAIPHVNGLFWCYNSVPKDKITWWESLPTR